jgi:hypothetical protein
VIARRVLITLAALTLAPTACTSQVGGQANPSSSAVDSTAPPSNANPFASLNSCTMLDQVLAGQGFPKAEPTIARSKESCRASKPTSGNTPGVDVALSLQAGQNYKDNVGNPSQASEGNVNGRLAVEEREPEHSSGQCGVWLEVKPNSRALVLAAASSSDTATVCKLVEGFAEKIEPLLPKNN